MRRRLATALCSALAAIALAGGGEASADVFGPISLVSAEPGVQQADYAHDPAVSGDGHYLAFDGSIGGIRGVWRRDLRTGAVEAVAPGDAELPSISQNGQYISFTTTAALAPLDHNSGPDVYVRDMSRQSSEAGAYTLASAVGGAEGTVEEGLAYQSSDPTKYGSLAAGRSALSADGRKVAFVTTATSDLVGPRPPHAPTTPPLQVAVRDLVVHTTQLVSVVRGTTEQPVSAAEGAGVYGAAYAAGGAPPVFKEPTSYQPPTSIGASISGDGSTVAWLGQNVGLQALLLPAETLIPRYTEPLWRRIADGPAAPVRRITGGSDPENPACAASGETSLSGEASAKDPCQGPFATLKLGNPGTWTGAGVGNSIPQLSADGYTVAFLSDAPLVALGSGFGIENAPPDLFAANMHPGLTRVQALRPLTELASGEPSDLATDAQLIDLGISADGTKVAFTTKRTVFPLGAPTYVTAPAAIPGMVELFDVNLSDETLTRVSHGYEGGASEHPHPSRPPGEDPYLNVADGALSPSYTSDGNTLAFSSTASNLVRADGNTPIEENEPFDGSDAFIVSRMVFGAVPTAGYISSPPPNPAIAPEWRLSATAASRPDGSVALYVTVPGMGSLRGTADSTMFVGASSSSRARRRSHAGRTRRVVVARTVASSVANPSAGGIVTLMLRLGGRDSFAASRAGGLYSLVTLRFTATGHPAIQTSLAVTFRRTARTAARAGRVRRKAHRGHR
jgi:hypothetical protein